jgi:hypothetical protein
MSTSDSAELPTRLGVPGGRRSAEREPHIMADLYMMGVVLS